jgi:hypothetical protein
MVVVVVVYYMWKIMYSGVVEWRKRKIYGNGEGRINALIHDD